MSTETSTAPTAEKRTETPVERLERIVAARTSRLQKEYQGNVSTAVAALALLRRGINQGPGADARILGHTVADVEPAPEKLRGDHPTHAEIAAHAAMTLFALHQQSQRTASMHRVGYSFGRSARLLGRHTGNPDAVRARFTAVATATSWEERLHHARGLIQQLRANGIPLDYGRFARDLYYLQFPSGADSVRLAWGRDFYRVRNADDPETEDSDGDDADDND
ncbi:type I-E CRISPR-associated protein Cse2/CasB [Microbacterium sp. No. 7]|uniref:type I-E CRISPR-associated protein Cse2/CasB n=1 Tax=Microbacterium sp. No. 7 TaxID=1714373 RepID=UPI0006D03258|nr:type I-E CRISPR-associated protein Cse2/CasB [Microbacterium sp. No. 7]ALJ18534.1 hypothetical protein AOA12_00825 [Microbacterium sp. No. 7]